MQVEEQVARALRAGGTAVFDADGTLWADDVGESFLRALEALSLVPSGSWAEYERRHAADAADAYAFAVTAMAGLREAQVRELAERHFERHFAPRVFPAMRALLAGMQAAGVRVAIVSASNRWSVEAGARVLGVGSIAGISARVARGVLTSELARPLSTGTGKIDRARELLGSIGLGAGNGANDLPLLASSREALVVRPVDASTELSREAERRGWPVVALAHPCPSAPLP